MTSTDFDANALADRVNCYALGSWIDELADRGGVPLRAPLGQGRNKVAIPIVKMGLTVTLFRHAGEELSEQDQIVFYRVAFDPTRARLPFGIDGRSLTPAQAMRIVSNDAAGGRRADFQRGDFRVSHFLPADARVVEVTFQPTLVGISTLTVFRLGGEIPYDTLDRRFGTARLGAGAKI